jgi:hypothetical protein
MASAPSAKGDESAADRCLHPDDSSDERCAEYSSVKKLPAENYPIGTRNNSSSSNPGNTGRSVVALNVAIRHDGLQSLRYGRVGSNITHSGSRDA